jgi:hypothetical protein
MPVRLDKVGNIEPKHLLAIVQKLAEFSRNYRPQNIKLVDRSFKNVVNQAH